MAFQGWCKLISGIYKMKSKKRRSQDKPPGSEQPKSKIARQPAAKLPKGYVVLLENIKNRIRSIQVKAVLSANKG